MTVIVPSQFKVPVVKEEFKAYEIDEGAHAPFSPSAADQWLNCPGRGEQIKPIPSEGPSSYAEEGTLAHQLCEDMILEAFTGMPVPDKTRMAINAQPDFGAEMTQCAQDYLKFIESWFAENSPLGEILWWGVEKAIPIYPHMKCFGTADFVAVGKRGAVVIDFKYGKGRLVSRGSSQLKLYGLGVLQGLENLPPDYQIHTAVFQPRINTVPNIDIYDEEELDKFGAKVIRAIANTMNKDNNELKAGSHCFWCPARRTTDPNLKCPSVFQQELETATQPFDRFLSQGNAVIPRGDKDLRARRDEALIKLLHLMPLLQKTASDAQEEFLIRLQNGESISGVQLTSKQGRREWKSKNLDEMEAMIQGMFPGKFPKGCRVVKESIMTLGAVERVVGKNKATPLTIKSEKITLGLDSAHTTKILNDLSEYQKTLAQN